MSLEIFETDKPFPPILGEKEIHFYYYDRDKNVDEDSISIPDHDGYTYYPLHALHQPMFSQSYLDYYFPFLPKQLRNELSSSFLEKLPYNQILFSFEEKLEKYHYYRAKGKFVLSEDHTYSICYIDSDWSGKSEFRYSCVNTEPDGTGVENDLYERLYYLQNEIYDHLSEIRETCCTHERGFKIYNQVIRENKGVLPESLLQELEKYVRLPLRYNLSSLKIDRDFRIFLPEYDNLEIELAPMPKALFFLFLRHPEGIKLNDLPDFNGEFKKIYLNLSQFESLEKIETNAENLLSHANQGVIYTNFCRIKEVFVKEIADEWAKNYYITGERGQKKSILLSRSLVSWEEEIR